MLRILLLSELVGGPNLWEEDDDMFGLELSVAVVLGVRVVLAMLASSAEGCMHGRASTTPQGVGLRG